MNNPPAVNTLPVLTEVLRAGIQSPAVRSSLLGPDLLGQPALDVPALEQRLVDELMQRFSALLEQRVHASVAPAVSLLADRIAYKAAQEVASDLAERMRDDLQAAVRQALDDIVNRGV